MTSLKLYEKTYDQLCGYIMNLRVRRYFFYVRAHTLHYTTEYQALSINIELVIVKINHIQDTLQRKFQ